MGIPASRLKREVQRGHSDAYKSRGAWCFTWRQLACIALRRWTLAEIHDALGDDAATVLPPLLMLRSLTVRLPEYLVRALETIAAEDGTTVEGCLEGELMDFAGTIASRIETAIPGFRRAYLFPGME